MCDHGHGLDGQTVAHGMRMAGTGSKLQAGIDGSGVAYEAHRYKQGWADQRAGRRASQRSKFRNKTKSRFYIPTSRN